jgi:thioredoxin 1
MRWNPIMKKFGIINSSIVILCLTINYCENEPASLPASPQKAVAVGAADFDRYLSGDSIIGLVEFYSGNDQSGANHFSVIDSLYEHFRNSAFIGVSNADQDTLWKRFSVSNFPAYLFFSGGKEVKWCVFPENATGVYDTLAVTLERLRLDKLVSIDRNNSDTINALPLAMVEFYTPSCHYCIGMEPIIAALADTFAGVACIAKINALTEDSLRAAYAISGWPTFLFFKNGVEYHRILGSTSFASLAAAVRRGLDGSAEQ